MARSKIRTTLDVSREQTPSVIIAKKLDINSRFFNAVILDSGRPLFIPQTSTAVLNAKRSDGEKQVFSCVINPNGTITAPLSPWLLELSGDCICDISIYGSDETKLTTVSFTVRVDGCVVEPEEIEEDADYTAVHDILLEATAALGSMAELKTSVEAAEALRQQGYNQAAAAVNAAVQSANEAATAANTAAEAAEAAAIAAEKSVKYDVSNVRYYGAAGDGVTDDTDSILAAMAEKRSLYFPEGTYLIRKQIDLTQDISWHGDGEKSIIKLLPLDKSKPEQYGGRTVYNSYMLAAANQPISIELRDMVFDANKDAFINDVYNNGASKYDHTVCIDAQKPSNVVLDNVTFKNALIEGVYIWVSSNPATKVQVSNCRFSDNGYEDDDASGLHCEGNHKRTTITNCRFENNGFHGLLLACSYANVSNIVACGNKHDGVMLWGGASYNNIHNVQSFGNRAGLAMKANYSSYDKNDDSSRDPISNNRIVNFNSYQNKYGLLLGNNSENTFLLMRLDDEIAIALCNTGTCTGTIDYADINYTQAEIVSNYPEAEFEYEVNGIQSTYTPPELVTISIQNEQWTQGSIDSETGTDAASTHYIRTVGSVNVPSNTMLTFTAFGEILTEGTKLSVYEYDSDGAFVARQYAASGATITTNPTTSQIRIRAHVSTVAEGSYVTVSYYAQTA